jgi:hypothetical protein
MTSRPTLEQRCASLKVFEQMQESFHERWRPGVGKMVIPLGSCFAAQVLGGKTPGTNQVHGHTSDLSGAFFQALDKGK